MRLRLGLSVFRDRTFVFLGLWMCAGASPAIAETHVVQVNASMFTPSTVNIAVGDTVRWEWSVGLHSTTSVGGSAESWDSGTHTPPFSFEHTYSQEGSFKYYCVIHGVDLGNGQTVGMGGAVNVGEQAPTFLGEFAGSMRDKNNNVVGSAAIRVTTLGGGVFAGFANAAGSAFTPVNGTLSAAGKIRFVLTLGARRQRTTYTFNGQYSADLNTIAGSVARKKGTKKTNLKFTANRDTGEAVPGVQW